MKVKTPLTFDLLTEMTEDRMSRADIAKETGWHLRTVEKKCKQLGVKPRRKCGYDPDPLRRAAVIAAVEAGCKTKRMIAERMGITRQAVIKYVRELVGQGLLNVDDRHQISVTPKWYYETSSNPED